MIAAVPGSFGALRLQAKACAEAGDFAAALAILDRAREQAAAAGDRDQIDLAVALRAAILIEQDEGGSEAPRLREILLRSECAESCHFAAYNLARFHELRKDFRKALFYARIARDRAELTGQTEWVGWCHNLIGNSLLAQGFVAEATAEYERALTLVPRGPDAARARVLDNLGYCRVLAGEMREGFRLLHDSLRTLIRLRRPGYEVSSRLDLCFAHLEAGRHRQSLRHGRAALEVARRVGDSEGEKNALYLIGVAAGLAGEQDLAGASYRELQESFFPEQSFLPGFLAQVDVRTLVNLHA